MWLFDSSHNYLCYWYVSTENPSFTFPDDKLQLGQEYIFRIEAIDLEGFELSGDGSYCYAENFSYLEIDYTASVPIPATLLLLGSGLAGLAGLKRKLKKGSGRVGFRARVNCRKIIVNIKERYIKVIHLEA